MNLNCWIISCDTNASKISKETLNQSERRTITTKVADSFNGERWGPLTHFCSTKTSFHFWRRWLSKLLLPAGRHIQIVVKHFFLARERGQLINLNFTETVQHSKKIKKVKSAELCAKLEPFRRKFYLELPPQM